jgi:hypothetical protein
MSLITASPYTDVRQYIRKIKCQRHYALKPGGTPFVMERDPRWVGKVSEKSAREIGFSTMRSKKNKYGQWIQNFQDYWQPDINPNLAREQWFDIRNPICQGCKRCVIR